jgi:hypothetical protein
MTRHINHRLLQGAAGVLAILLLASLAGAGGMYISGYGGSRVNVRERLDDELAQARQDLQNLLTLRQEALLVQQGFLE